MSEGRKSMLRGALGRRNLLTGVAAALGGCAIPSVRAAAAAAPATTEQGPALRAQRLTWAGVRLQLEATTLFLDPLITPDVWGPALKDPMVPFDVSTSSRFVLVTHRHPDHFDVAAARKILGENGRLVCAPEVAAFAASVGFKTRVAPLYEPVLLDDDFTATAVPAVDGYGDPQVSWVVRGGGRRIIHCGDTLWHGSWWHIGRQFGPFDAAFLPINGARFAWRKPVSEVSAVMTPEQAVAAAVVLGARLIVPIHYGVVGADGYSELPDPEGALLQAARRRNMPVEIVRPGDWLTWKGRGVT
ncbi:MBL fold metallo-hydrolase [Pendulispora albinea]|uniref:MBL fold metallo-hydrolase n=1 Tax=Pendulispora albinea TaxID=2741071 RepID=A0ABZ2LYI2_9BACT